MEVCYLDFRKAFDTVNHRLLIQKLINLGIPSALVKWIGSFLTNRSFCVSTQTATSSEAPVGSGVPQGSVLGPLLFVVYVNDLLLDLPPTSFMFTDDLKVVGNPNKQDMQVALETIGHWSEKWMLPINHHKSGRLCSAAADLTDRQLMCNGISAPLNRLTEVKDLGVRLDPTFKPRLQCLEAAKKANKALFQMVKTLQSRYPNLMVPLFKTLFTPHIEYCIQAWVPST